MNRNGNIYADARKKADLTQAEASELIEKVAYYKISEDRISRIERGEAYAEPEEVLAMAKAYKRLDLCNKYCVDECPLGINVTPQLEVSQLSDIIIRMISTLNTIDTEKNRLIDIAADGKITEDEFNDFAKIQAELQEISILSQTLSTWVTTKIGSGDIDSSFKEIQDTEVKNRIGKN